MISIGFSTGKYSPISAIIRRATGSKVSHAFVIYDDPLLKKRLIMEADEGGFQIYPLSRFTKKNKLVKVVQPKYPLDSGLEHAARWLGEAYDYLGLFGGIWMMIGRYFKRKWNNPLHASKSMFCSEAVVRVLHAAKYPGSNRLVPYDTTPQDLLDFLIVAEG